MANIKEYLVLLFVFILPSTDSLFSEITLTNPATSVHNVETQSQIEVANESGKSSQSPPQNQEKSTLKDININELLGNPTVRNALTMTKQKKRYMIVHKNGEVEYVDSMQEIENKHSNFKIVSKDNIRKAMTTQLNDNNLSLPPENVPKNLYSTSDIYPTSNQLQSKSILTSKSETNQANISTATKKHYKVMHHNGKVEYIDSLENLRQKYPHFVLLDKKHLIDELNKRVLPSLIMQNNSISPQNISSNKKSIKTLTVASVNNGQDDNGKLIDTAALRISLDTTKPYVTSSQSSSTSTISKEKTIQSQDQNSKGVVTEIIKENPSNSIKYDLVGLPNIENIRSAFEEDKIATATYIDKKLRIRKISNDVEDLRAVISPPSTSLLLQKLIHEDSESVINLKEKTEYPVIHDSNYATTTVTKENDNNKQPESEVTNTSSRIQANQNLQSSKSKNRRVLTEAEMVEWASSFMSLPYSAITVQMTPRQLDLDPNGTISIKINV